MGLKASRGWRGEVARRRRWKRRGDETVASEVAADGSGGGGNDDARGGGEKPLPAKENGDANKGKRVLGWSFRKGKEFQIQIKSILWLEQGSNIPCTLKRREEGEKKAIPREKCIQLEMRGIDPRTSRMLSERSTI